MMTDCLAEVAADLLRTDGIAVIWQAHITAARANRDGYRKAAEILLRIADAAEDATRRNPAQIRPIGDAVSLFQLVGRE